MAWCSWHLSWFNFTNFPNSIFQFTNLANLPDKLFHTLLQINIFGNFWKPVVKGKSKVSKPSLWSFAGNVKLNSLENTFQFRNFHFILWIFCWRGWHYFNSNHLKFMFKNFRAFHKKKNIKLRKWMEINFKLSEMDTKLHLKFVQIELSFRFTLPSERISR